MHGGKKMKQIQNEIPSHGRLKEISLTEIKNKYGDKVVNAYAEGGRLVVVLDTCRIKFDERVPQRKSNVYGSLHK